MIKFRSPIKGLLRVDYSCTVISLHFKISAQEAQKHYTDLVAFIRTAIPIKKKIPLILRNYFKMKDFEDVVKLTYSLKSVISVDFGKPH